MQNVTLQMNMIKICSIRKQRKYTYFINMLVKIFYYKSNLILNLLFESWFQAPGKEHKGLPQDHNRYELLYEQQEIFVSDQQGKTNVV